MFADFALKNKQETRESVRQECHRSDSSVPSRRQNSSETKQTEGSHQYWTIAAT